MARPTVHDDTIEKVNQECEEIMTANPESVQIDERIKILAESHADLREQLEMLEKRHQLSGNRGAQGVDIDNKGNFDS